MAPGSPAGIAQAAWAALLAHPEAVVGYGTAALLHGLATFRSVPGLELVRSAGAGRTPKMGATPVRIAALPASQVSEPQGVPSTSLARTAVDLARAGSVRDGVVALDSALQLGCQWEELEDVVSWCSGWPGSIGLRQAFDVADPGSESPLESLAHVVQAQAGLPRALTQVSIYDARGLIGRVDDYWPEHATVGESDGMLKYDANGALRAEKLRQERLEQAGLQVVRVSYPDVTQHPLRTADRYREAFERGRMRLAWRPLSVTTSASPSVVVFSARASTLRRPNNPEKAGEAAATKRGPVGSGTQWPHDLRQLDGWPAAD